MVYGRPEIIMASLTKRIKATTKVESESLEQLIQFSIEVQSIATAVRVCNLESYFGNPTLLQSLVDKLPASRRLEWADRRSQLQIADIGDFSDWLMERAEAACDVLPLESVMHISNKSKTRKEMYVSHIQSESKPNYSGSN